MHTFKRFLLMILFGSLMGCATRTPDQSRVPLLEVEGKYFYLDQLDGVIPSNISAADSIQLADSYIKKWVTDVLLYENAKRNVTDKAEIDKLLEDYKKSLIIHQYNKIWLGTVPNPLRKKCLPLSIQRSAFVEET